MTNRLLLLLVLLLPTWLLAAWHQPSSQFRRPLTLEMEEGKITGEELVTARFLANGKQLPDAKDVRVVTLQGKPTPYRITMAGQGDWLDISFNAVKGTRDYLVYFADSKPADPPTGELNRGGLLMEMKSFSGEMASSTPEMRNHFDRAKSPLGSRVVPKLYMGVNPFGSQPTITRFTGKIFAPVAGTYIFALAADDRAGLEINGKPLVFCRHPVNDARFQERLQLERGWHDLKLYMADSGGEFRLTAAWKRPDAGGFEVIGPEFFAIPLAAMVGPLEQQDKPLTADMQAAYLGEGFFATHYTHRYRFELQTNLRNADRLSATWDFGDGQTGTGKQLEHVYLSADTYTVTLEVASGANRDKQTFRLAVDRDWDRSTDPPTDDLGIHQKLVAAYDLQKLPAQHLPHATYLFLRTSSIDDTLKSAKALAAAPKHPNRPTATKAIEEVTDELLKRKEPARLREVFDALPPSSDLYPWAAEQYAQLLMYSLGDFEKAAAIAKAAPTKDPAVQRSLGQALILSGKYGEGAKLLESLPTGAVKQKVAALSGALARSTEFYVHEKDVQGGEAAWDKWMASFPSDFLDGNAALMRVKLIHSRGFPDVAAKVAEAYANANPKSAYSPQLLNLASEYLAQKDSAKSAALKQLLRQRYPEDPLSQK